MASGLEEPSWMGRVAEMAARSDELAREMNRPEVAAGGALLVRLARERGRLEKIAKRYREYRRVSEQLEESQRIIADPTADAELRELAEAERPQLVARRAGLLEALKEKLLTGEQGAISSILLEIRAGTGGEEAALFAGELLEMYLAYAARQGFKTEVLSLHGSELGGVREAIVNISGEEVYLHYRFEAGGHRVQRVPKTESQGRIHTSAATVAVLPEPEGVEVEIDWDKEVVEHVSRAGGPGGQNVNKVASAIKLEHVPTGITVSMRDEKSQHKNRAKARRILRSRVYEHHRRLAEQKLAAERRSMVGSGDRSERIRTYNFPQNRCTDHRINKDVYDLEGILAAGRLEEFLPELRERELKLRLEKL